MSADCCGAGGVGEGGVGIEGEAVGVEERPVVASLISERQSRTVWTTRQCIDVHDLELVSWVATLCPGPAAVGGRLLAPFVSKMTESVGSTLDRRQSVTSCHASML